ncbi:hypothetical protein [Streptomyces sp. NPDC001657]|uniref:hypothetical protein n=1 Tax=Streptomyces sp. NPDC001657 TaxID=3154522 RepID=UPI00332FF981
MRVSPCPQRRRDTSVPELASSPEAVLPKRLGQPRGQMIGGDGVTSGRLPSLRRLFLQRPAESGQSCRLGNVHTLRVAGGLSLSVIWRGGPLTLRLVGDLLESGQDRGALVRCEVGVVVGMIEEWGQGGGNLVPGALSAEAVHLA